ncbi:RNA polymerase factor sigma-54 [Pseudovibrio exalbescens]|uniref:RNA polymerase factor sigma-54 n=1 Tax=Pseudovibrio exalbescens TaxID=197461 RepID=UPI0023669CBD|nr:RNA polymerase factor sigma-54 [Pseudovibrio exalbescens]MDD7909809.1 RNA polymerase factor sigma-54 [Pseudovibrio exalbescens]
MALTPKLEIRQSQQLVMTPQLMQAIKLLQLSSLDLVSYVENELESNPFLERAEEEYPSSGEGNEAPSLDAGEAASTPSDDEGAGDWMESQLETNPGEIASRMDADLQNVFPDDNGTPQTVDPSVQKGEQWQPPSNGAISSGDYNLEAFVAADVSLKDFLVEQMSLVVTSAADQLIAKDLIDSLDDSGYLYIDEAETAERLGIEPEHLDRIIKALQALEPSGVFARSLNECLAIQLREKDRFDPAMEKLVENIDLLAKYDMASLKRLCEVDDEDLTEMIYEIKALNPKPGSSFGSEAVQPVVPDAIVRPGNDGGWVVELNSETLPRVLVNQSYYSEISTSAKSDGDLAYFTDCIQTANWLVKSLDQRAKTILKVASEIVRQQDGFLTYGVQHLRPMNLKTIADAISMHESTVSRVTSNKYIATPRGIFELKYFFSSSINATEGGDALSGEAVRYKIKQLIDNEDPKAILSDDTLVKLLKEDGVDIARRTVAKYREAMKIPSSVQRRREKKAKS